MAQTPRDAFGSATTTCSSWRLFGATPFPSYHAAAEQRTNNGSLPFNYTLTSFNA